MDCSGNLGGVALTKNAVFFYFCEDYNFLRILQIILQIFLKNISVHILRIIHAVNEQIGSFGRCR